MGFSTLQINPATGQQSVAAPYGSTPAAGQVAYGQNGNPVTSAAPPAASSGQQSPGIFGTGQYYAPNYSGFNPTAISGQTNQVDGNYGLNTVWSNLQNLSNSLAPQNLSAVAPTGTQAYGSAAQGTAALGNSSSYNAGLGTAAQSAGAVAGAANAGNATMGYGPTISTAGDASQLAVQQNLENTLQNQANGGGVSAADLQLKQGQDQQVASQLAMLGSQRGGAMNAGLAQNAAATQSAQAQAQLNAQMGVQRAQETQAAQQALGNVAGTARGQSQNYNTAQAGLAQQNVLANQNAANNMAQFNTANEQQANLANAQLMQGNSQFNAGNSQAMNLANMNAVNSMGQYNATNAQNMTLANLQAQNAMTSQNVGNNQNMALANLGDAQGMNLANLQLQGQYGLANQQTQLQNNAQYYQNLLAALGAQTGISEANRSADLAGQQLGVQQQLGNNQINAQAFQAAANANSNLTGAIFGGLAGLGSTGLNALTGGGSGSAVSTGLPVPSSAGGGTMDGGSDGSAGNAYTGDQSYSDNTGDGEFSDENVKEGIEGGNPMLQSFLSSVGQSKEDQSINPTADMGFRLGTYGKQTSTSGPSDGGIGKTVGSAVGSIGGAAAGTAGGAAAAAAAGAAAGSVVPGIGTAIGAIGGLLGGLLGGAAGSAADGSSSSSSRNVLMSQGTGETATDGTISDLDEDNPIATSDDEAKENVQSGNRGMQAFLEQAGAQQKAQGSKGSSNNAFMQTGQSPNTTADRPMPAPPPWMQGYGQPQNMGGTYGGGGGMFGGAFGAGNQQSGGVGPMGWSGGGMYQQGGVSNMGGVYQGGGTNGTPQAPQAAPTVALFGGTGSPTLTPSSPVFTAPVAAASNPLTSLNAGIMSTAFRPNPVTAAQNAANTVQGAIGQIDAQRALALSDEGAKTDVADPDEDDVQGFLDSVHAHQYRYKEPDMPGAGRGTFVSPMAQEIERTPLGKNFVFTDPATGYKKVDYGKMSGTLLAGQAMLNERLNDMEGFMKAARGGR